MSKQLTYLIPTEASQASEAAAVGRRAGKLLDALETMTQWVAGGELPTACHDFKVKMIDELRAEGWRVYVSASDKWTVLRPL